MADSPNTVEDTVAKIEETINAQIPALDESMWADAPELTEAQEQALAAAARQGAAGVEFDDTNHADGEGAEQPKPAPSPPAEKPVDDELPAGETDDEPADEVGEAQVAQEPEYDPTLLAAAGLATVDEAKILFGSPKALENAVRLMDARSVAVAQQGATPPAAPAAPAEQQKPLPAADAKPEFKMPNPPEGEEWDETTVALVKGLQDQFSAQLAKQQAVIEAQAKQTEQILSERKAIEIRRYVEDFDGFVNALPDEWTDTLGKGSGFELSHDGVAMKARIQLDQTAKLLADGRASQGQPPLPLNDLLSRALRVAFPQKQEQAVRKQVEREVKHRENLKTARPTVRSGAKPKNGVDAAAETAEKWYAKRGMAALPNDDFEYDSI